MTIFEKAMINDIIFFKHEEYNINEQDEFGKSLLHYAVLGNAHEVVEELIKRGINVNIVDNDGETPIFDCSRKAKIEIAKVLIINYAKLNLKNNLGETLFHLASAKGDKRFLRLLVENTNSVLNTMTIDYKYPVHYAVLAGHIDILKYVLSVSNQSFLILDKNNDSLLHYAAKTSNDLLIYFLISEGINPNLLNNSYETALFNAIRFGTKETVAALLSSDAYIDIKNINNEYSVDIARIYEKYQIETLLTNYQMLPKYERLKKNQVLTIATLNRDLNLVKNLLKNHQTMRYDKYNFSALDYAKLYKFNDLINELKNCPIV